MTHRTLPLVGLALLAASPLLPAQQRGVVTFGEALDDLTVGGSLRMRVENRNATPPVVGAPADTLGTLRARVFLDATFSERLGAKVEFQHVVADQGQPSDEFLYQAWLAWSDVVPGGDLQVGRMQLRYGSQRMISDLQWSMVGRAWDGAVWSQDFGGVQGDLFWTQPVEGMSIPTGTEQAFGGAYFEFDAGPLDIDVYGLSRRDRMVGGMGRTDQTYGVLLETDPAQAWTFSFEGATQVGSSGMLDAAGSAFAVRTDFAVTDRFRVGVGYELATGDDDPTDGDDEAFIPLFDFVHAYHGNQDLFTWTNLQDIVVRTSFQLDEDWILYLNLHDFSLAEEAGGIPNPGLTAVAGEDHLGTEVDFGVKGNLGPGVVLWAGASAFQAGDAIQNGDDQLWLFANLDLWL